MRTIRLLATVCLTVSLTQCAEDPGGPGRPGFASIVVQLPTSSAFSSSAALAIQQVHALVGVPSTTEINYLVDKIVSWNVNQNTLNVSLDVPLSGQSVNALLSLDFETAQGTPLFTTGQSVALSPGSRIQAQLPPPTYIGPGTNTAFITITPQTPTVTVGGSVSFTVAATDANLTPVPDVYISWKTLGGGSINALGTFTAPSTAGAVQITATTPPFPPNFPNGVADTVTVTVLPTGSGAMSGLVVDGSTQAPLGGATVNILDAATGGQVASVTTAADGSYSTGALPPATYNVSVTLTGYVSTQLFGATLSGSGVTTLQTIPLAPSTRLTGSIDGVVRDATTNIRIQGATVELRAGVNATTGTPLVTTTVDTAGAFFFGQVPAGTYTVVAIASGYTNGSRTSVSLGGVATTGQDLILSPTGSGNVRIVLTWGLSPADLDAHLTGPDPSTGGRFHIYYANQGSGTVAPFASLDVDDTDSFGPETATIAQQFSGIYRFSVHDYTNSSLNPSSALAASGARVDLYIGGALVRQFFVPNQPGTLWTVFELDGNNITPVNTMSYETNSDAVQVRLPGAGSDEDLIYRAAESSPKR